MGVNGMRETELLQEATVIDFPLRVPRPEPAILPSVQPFGCLHELFEAKAAEFPERPAILCGTEILSYQNLNSQANQLARFLQFSGMGPGSLVGIYFERSQYPIIAILACLKAGAAYVPLDPAYPEDRIRFILAESEIRLLLTETSLKAKADQFFDGQTVALDVANEAIQKQPVWSLTRTETGVTPSDLCYVIYTSGTTGRPKGVMTEHRNAYSFVVSFNEVCATTPHERVYQGFSLGFDGSVEEIWMAFSNGSALVVGTKNTPRFGNDLAQFLSKNQVNYFSTVPTMVSTLTEEIPSLRQLVVSGEACPEELVNQWSRPDLKIWNVYGPTEATVNTTVKECRPGNKITIGQPLSGYDTYILDSELKPVLPGEKGELFVSGPGLCRGYLKQPELTAKQFIQSPYVGGSVSPRLYRTGDLVRLNTSGELEFFGRIDTQVKIRGFRVELSEIESVLRESDNVRSAAVKLFERDGLQELAAYVVLKNPREAFDRSEVLAKLSARLPDYMIPGFLDVLSEFPTLTSGKVDRSKLPLPVLPLLKDSGKLILPENGLETQIETIWAKLFGVAQISVEDDFFLNLGGHSLLAAQMVTRLRSEVGADVAVRDAYRFPSVRKLARYIESQNQGIISKQVKEKVRTSQEVYESLSKTVRMAVPSLQAVSLYFLFAFGTSILCTLFLVALSVYRENLSIQNGIEITLGVGFVTWPFLLLLSVAGKWLLIGKYQEGEHPVWGLYYFRWWLATRLQLMSGAGAFSGTPLMGIYYRLMGAKVGRNCTLDSVTVYTWDLLSIGEETAIGSDTQILGYRVENGLLKFGKAKIGKRCFVGIHSALGLNVEMGDDSALDDQSFLADNQKILMGETHKGSPSQKAKVNLPNLRSHQAATRATRILFGAAHLVLIYALAFLLLIPSLPFAALLLFWVVKAQYLFAALTAAASVPLGVIAYALFIAGLKKAVLSRSQPGTYSVHSLFYLRKWFVDDLMKASRALLLPLYTTMYFPPWLRLMGANIGPRAELSTVWYFSPDLVEIGAESFFADGSIVGGKRFFRGVFEIGKNKIGRRSFVGNSAILPVGKGLGDQCLLGVLSTPPLVEDCVPDGSEWLGSPAFNLPNRQKIGNFSNDVTFQPTRKLYLQRAIVDALRIMIPGYIALFAGILSLVLMYLCYREFGTLRMFLIMPFVELGVGLLSALAVVLLKKSVMGKFEPVVHPLWSMYVWLNEMVNGAYESVMARILAPFLGTPFVAPLLRTIGVRVGKHNYIDTTLFSEFDLIEIGDYVALNSGAILQTHLFEDRIMKSDSLTIENGASVGNMTVVLYRTEVQSNVSIAPLSLVMKGDTLSPSTRWEGIPVSRVN